MSELARQGMGFQEEADVTAAAAGAGGAAFVPNPWFGPADAAAVQGLPGIVIPAPHAGAAAAAPAGHHAAAAGQPLVVPPLPVGMHQQGILPVGSRPSLNLDYPEPCLCSMLDCHLSVICPTSAPTFVCLLDA